MSDKKIKDFFDKNNLLTAGPLGGMDGGDSMARTMTMNYCVTILFPDRNTQALVQSQMDVLKSSNGRYVRNPDPNQWYSNYETLSRDQMTPMLADLIADQSHKSHRNNLFIQHLKHLLLFTWNVRNNDQYTTQAEQTQKLPDVPWNYKWKIPDPTALEIMAMWIRAFRAWPLYPLLLILDLQTLGTAIYRKIAYMVGKNPDIDSVNTILPTHISANFLPTPVGMLAFYILTKTPIANELNQFFAQRIDQPPIDQYVLKLLGLAYQNDTKLPCEE